MMVRDILLRLKDVSKVEDRQGRDRKALRKVNLEISRRDFISIVETETSNRDLLFSILSLIESPSTGSIFLGSREVSDLPESKLTKLRLKHLGIVFMHNYFVDELTVMENIEMFLKEAGVPKKEIRPRVMKALELVGMHDKAGFKPPELSKYELKAVDVARALAKGPSILLVNEPTEAPNGQGRTILDLIKRVHSRTEMAVVFTTTSRKLGRRAKRAFLLKDGVLKVIAGK